MSEPAVPNADEWQAWSPDEVGRRLAGSAVDWAVAGGWALDLCRGAQSRPHKDIEIVVGEGALPVIRAQLRGYPFFAAQAGRLAPLAEQPAGKPQARQHWVLDPAASKWRLDVMVEPGDAHRWIYRRDRRITARRADAVAWTGGNIPYLRPHIVLLFKSHHPRACDEWDFDASLDLLDRAGRDWLRDALAVTSPRHAWLGRLG